MEVRTVDGGVFGEFGVPDDGLVALDGGTHGRVGHTFALHSDGSVVWERRLDSMGDQSACSGSGRATLETADLATARSYADALWEAAALPAEDPGAPKSFDPPRYSWAIAVRRGDEVRQLDGPPFGHPFLDPGPDPTGEFLDWANARVDAWCEAARKVAGDTQKPGT